MVVFSSSDNLNSNACLCYFCSLLSFHQFCFGQIWSKCHLHISCNILFLCFPATALCIFLQKIEGKTLLWYLKWVIPWQCLFQVGKIGHFTENSFVLELFWEGVKFVLLEYYYYCCLFNQNLVMWIMFCIVKLTCKRHCRGNPGIIKNMK